MLFNVFIPLAEGQSIPYRTLKSISMQTVPTSIIPCVSKGVIVSNGAFIKDEDKKEKICSEVVNRNKIPELIATLGITDKYVIMQDRDAEHLYEDNFEKAISFLNDNKDYAAIALPSNRACDREKHIIITCVVFRTEFMRKFTFRVYPEFHTCDSVYKDIIASGHKYNYLVFDRALIYELNL